MIVSIDYHKDGVGFKSLKCVIIIEDHPSYALNKAYALLREIMDGSEPWYISSLHYSPSTVDTMSRMEVRASLKTKGYE